MMEETARKSLSINFLLPSVSISGGVKSTLELANRLAERGHEVRVIYPRVPEWMRERTGGLSLFMRRARHLARGLAGGVKPRWFALEAQALRVPSMDAGHVPPADVTVATNWHDAFNLAVLPEDRGAKVYLIRHYEVWAGDPGRVDQSYLLPLHRVTTSSWLQQLIEERFGVEVESLFPNGIDTGVFFRSKGDFRPSFPRRVGLLYRELSWKGMDDALAAMQEAKNRFPHFIPVVFGDRPRKEHLLVLKGMGGFEFHPFPPPSRLREIYESLDIFLFPSNH